MKDNYNVNIVRILLLITVYDHGEHRVSATGKYLPRTPAKIVYRMTYLCYLFRQLLICVLITS